MKSLKAHNSRNLVEIFFVIILLLIMSCYSYASPVTKIDKETIKRITVDHIKKNMPWPQGTIRIEFSSRIPDVIFSCKDVTCRVENQRKEDFIGYAVFNIRFYNKGVFLKEKGVRVKLDVSKDVVVSSRFLSRNTRINYDDVKLVKKWFDRMPVNRVTDLTEVVGKTLCASLRQNSEIKRNMLRSPMVVKRGKLVRVIFERGPLVVTTVGLSQQNGVPGDLIKVKNMSSKKIIYATVMGNSLVRVGF